MISQRFKAGLIFALAVALIAGLIVMHLENRRLGRLIADQRQANTTSLRLRDNNRRLQELLAKSQREGKLPGPALQLELEHTRREVSELEDRARMDHGKMIARQAVDTAALATNRNPRQGPVRLEYFQPAGQKTPDAAFQTFVWAALQGKDATLANMIHIDEAVRADAASLVAALPEDVRSAYPTPESLAALYFADALTGRTSAEISNVTFPDATHATVEVQGLSDQTQKVPLQLGPEGWQIRVTPGLVKSLSKWVASKRSPSGK